MITRPTARSVLFLLPALLTLLLPALGDRKAAPVYQPVQQYDPKRDAAGDIDDAVAEARRSGRHVLIEVGGSGASGATGWTIT